MTDRAGHILSSGRSADSVPMQFKSIRMCTDIDGLGGKVLVVSGRGAFEYCLVKSEQSLYNLGESLYSLDGTLISIRIPYPTKEVSVYDFAD